MWRGVVKGAWGPLTRDAPRIDTKRQIESRKTGNGPKRQVWNTILKREAASMGHIHVWFPLSGILFGATFFS